MPDPAAGASAPEDGAGSGADVLAWLEPRLRDVPADLASAVRASVERVVDEPSRGSGPSGSGVAQRAVIGPLAGILARAALTELDRVTEMEGRGAALALLAADASLTYAFEAAAADETDPVELADAVGLRGAIGRRLRAPERPTGT